MNVYKVIIRSEAYPGMSGYSFITRAKNCGNAEKKVLPVASKVLDWGPKPKLYVDSVEIMDVELVL